MVSILLQGATIKRCRYGMQGDYDRASHAIDYRINLLSSQTLELDMTSSLIYASAV
jgi:hypothetical protein